MIIEEQKSLSELTRFGVGGPADYFAECLNLKDLDSAFNFARMNNLPVHVIGEGTNLIAADDGVRGLVVKIAFDEFLSEHDQKTVTAGAGVNLPALIRQVCQRGWAGMENMYGIPGTVGGAVYGNAGAYGTEIKDVIESVTVWDGEQVSVMQNSECGFTYRSSIFKTSKDLIILSVNIKLKDPEPGQSPLSKSIEIMNNRLQKYPEGLKCAGSFYKNIIVQKLTKDQQNAVSKFQPKFINGKLASGILLDAVGAKGKSVGGAKVADYHGNLIYNAGSAKASDVYKLNEMLKKMVMDEFGIELEEEVQFLGDFAG